MGAPPNRTANRARCPRSAPNGITLETPRSLHPNEAEVRRFSTRRAALVPASRLVSVAWDACFCHGTGALPVSEKDNSRTRREALSRQPSWIADRAERPLRWGARHRVHAVAGGC